MRQLDLAQCATEPIRVPGAIQPHGLLLVLDEDGSLLAYSDNWPDAAAARSAAAGLGRFDPRLLRGGEPPTVAGRVEIEGEPFEALAHRAGERIVLEFEPGEPERGAQAPIYTLARQFLPQLQRAGSVASLAELAVREIKRLTGFGRCLLYRFDRDHHGEVLAEECDAGYEAYLGHRFPASDIPAQARELYRVNHIRLIPDARYRPAALVGTEPGFDPRTIDLSWAGLRSVSPVHLEYMVNMGTLASMSVSIMVRGRLWGLVSCHDREPRHLPLAVRAACEHLGQLLSLQIEAKEDNAEVATRLELRQLTMELVAQLGDSDETLKQLVDHPEMLLRLGGAEGAVVMLDDQCWGAGAVPPEATLRALASWVAQSGRTVFHSNSVLDDCPGSGALEGLPAGVLAISISQVHRHLVLWLRPELVQTIQWAGDPRKQVRSDDGRIHPRRSFASWRELVRGRSAPWSASRVAAADELRQALVGIVLRRAQEMAEVAIELGRVNKELEAFSYTVSHDLRAPMRHIAGYVDLVLDMEGKQLSERARRYLAQVKEASAYAGHLVDALLDFSRMGRAELKRSDVDTQALVEDLVRHFQRQPGGDAAQWQVDGPLPVVRADPFLLQVAVRNLLDNALKYSRGCESPTIRVRALREADADGIEIADNGVGFQMKYVAKLFGVFQRLHQAEDFEGTGIGLASCKRIIERHGGTVRAEGEVGRGATFGFVLPRTPQPPRRQQRKEGH